MWHNYVQFHDTTVNDKKFYIPYGWWTFLKGDHSCDADQLYSDVSNYAQGVNGIINDHKNRGYWSFIERPKIEYLIRGQRSINECENSSNIQSEKFYTFNSGIGEDFQDSVTGGKWVKRCLLGVDSPNQYIVNDVNAKYEETACKGANVLFYDNCYYWYVKPRIRIPTGLSDNLEVCKIEVYNFDGENKLDKIILAADFKNDTGYYDGKYVEDFRTSEPDFLRLDGEDLKPSHCEHSNENTNFDIRVKWLGNSDMYIDYVKIESDVANKLFKSQLQGNYDQWILDEANLIGGTDGAYRFWIEEPDYNMLPCVKYVQDKIVSTYGFTKSTLIMNDYSCFEAPNQWGVGITGYNEYKEKYNSMNMSEIVSMCFPVYPFKLGEVISNEIQTSQYDYVHGLLGTPVPKSIYEDSLQSIFDTTLIGWQKKYAIRYAKENPEKPFYSGVTTMLNFYPNLGYTVQGSREPTNEEIETMVGIMISYGAKGIIYHCYEGFGELPNYNNTNYGRGLTNPPDELNPIKRRDTNVYGQLKWNSIKALNEKLTIWGPELMQFDNSLSESYRYHKIITGNSIDERIALKNKFIKYLNTYPNGNPQSCPQTDPNYNVPDNQDKTYLQVGVFYKSTSDPEKYFMLVNRRCNPGHTPCDGYRRVEVKLGGEDNKLDYFNNWKIVNLYDNSTVGVFDKRILNSKDLG